MSNGKTVKAQRAMVHIGNLEVEGFMLPNGNHRMLLSQAAECIGLKPQNASGFLKTETFKSLMGKSYTIQISEIESDAEQAQRGSRITQFLTCFCRCSCDVRSQLTTAEAKPLQ